MDVQRELYEYLTSKGCTVTEDAGIWFIDTPDGVLWDMTVPEVNTESEQEDGVDDDEN